jgi:hypothetical protein
MTLVLNPGPATGGQAVRSVTKSGEEVQIVAIDTAELPGGAMPMSAEELPLPTGAATQVTLAALNVIAAAIQTAVDAINGKTTAVNTGAIAGTVALDAPTLAALESITASTGGLTNTELRADPVPVSVAGAATETTLAAINTKTPALVGGFRPVCVSAFNYPISAANSSTTQLAAGASFTGTIETAQDQPSISILLTSDQPTTLTVRQFIDEAGTFAAPDIVFYVPAGAGFARSFPVNGNFVRVIAQNNGGSTTTTFNLNTAFGFLDNTDAQGAHPVTELPLLLTGAAAQTAVVNNILNPASGAAGTRSEGYRAASVQVVSTGTGGTFIFEQSNDGTNWIALPVFNAALVTAVPITAAITATASAIVYTFPIRCAFIRLRIATTITGGSIRAFSRLSTEPWTAAAQLVASNAAGNMLVNADTEFAAAAALADGAANPTTASGGALQSQFNGATWDRVRNNISVALDSSTARTTSGTGATFTNHSGRAVSFWVNVTAVTGTTPTLTVRVQWSPDNGATWLDMDTTNLQTASITGTSNATLRIGVGLTTAANAALNTAAPRLMRLAWTVGGTTPSFTFATWANTSA